MRPELFRFELIYDFLEVEMDSIHYGYILFPGKSLGFFTGENDFNDLRIGKDPDDFFYPKGEELLVFAVKIINGCSGRIQISFGIDFNGYFGGIGGVLGAEYEVLFGKNR